MFDHFIGDAVVEALVELKLLHSEGLVGPFECLVERANVLHSSDCGEEIFKSGLDLFEEARLDGDLEPAEEEVGVSEFVQLESLGECLDLLGGDLREIRGVEVGEEDAPLGVVEVPVARLDDLRVFFGLSEEADDEVFDILDLLALVVPEVRGESPIEDEPLVDPPLEAELVFPVPFLEEREEI